MAILPTSSEQDALLDAMGALVAARGPETLLRGPIEPTPQFFPDAWRPDLEGARVVLRRVLAYAGLPDLQIELEVGGRVRPSALTGAGRTHMSGAAAWFWGIADDVAWFGVDRGAMADPEEVVPALCHEAAHAFRRKYGLEGDPAEEELRTDVSTVFLGFGILTTNASSRTRTRGELRGSMAYHQWSHTSLGYLAPESMAFLLAAQAVVRSASWGERRRIQKQLEADQAAAFGAACRCLRRDAEALRRRLGVAADQPALPAPEPGALPPASGPQSEQSKRVPPEQPREMDVGLPASAPSRKAGRPVFRVPRTMATRSRRVLGFIVGIGAGSAVTVFASAGVWPGMLVGVVGAALAPVLVPPRREDECSEPTCCATLPPGATACPGCGGAISGEIRRAEDRLEAAERLAAGEPVVVVSSPRPMAKRVFAGAVACAALAVASHCAGIRPAHLLKPGPTLDVGCENDGWLGARCAPGDRLGFRVTSPRDPLYLAAYLTRDGSSGRWWLFPEEDGSAPSVRSSKPVYVLYVDVPTLEPGDYQLVAQLYSHLPTRAEVEAGGASALDREQITLSVRNGFKVGERQATTGAARMERPGAGSAPK